MKRFLVGALACATVLLTGGNASAANPHFVGQPAFSVVDGQFQAEGKVAGLGNIDQVEIELEVTAVCTNPAGKKPPGLKRVRTAEEFSVDNGQATFTLTTESVKKCPGKQVRSFEDPTLRVFVDGDQVLTFPEA